MRQPWTEEEDQLLRDNYPHVNIAVLVKFLGRTEGAIKVRANKYLNLCKMSKQSENEKFMQGKFSKSISKHYKECLEVDQVGRMGKFFVLFHRVAVSALQSGIIRSDDLNMREVQLAFEKVEDHLIIC